ncbi:MAG: hypothetical protein HN952_06155 [Candidatus Cloacimonetes bacterium]|nr:hypothetical protein [Candidatus Cloacimonadota bacterium]
MKTESLLFLLTEKMQIIENLHKEIEEQKTEIEEQKTEIEDAGSIIFSMLHDDMTAPDDCPHSDDPNDGNCPNDCWAIDYCCMYHDNSETTKTDVLAEELEIKLKEGE